MILSKEQADSRISSQRNLASRFGKISPSPKEHSSEDSHSDSSGSSLPSPEDNSQQASSRVDVIPMRRPGNPGYQLPKELKTTIAILARSGERQATLAEEFGTTQGEVSYIERGKSKGVDESIVDKKLGEIRDSALDRLTQAVLGITNDKLANTKAVDLSSIAKNLSITVEKISPRKETSTENTPRIVIYAPQIRDEASFNVVEVSAS